MNRNSKERKTKFRYRTYIYISKKKIIKTKKIYNEAINSFYKIIYYLPGMLCILKEKEHIMAAICRIPEESTVY